MFSFDPNVRLKLWPIQTARAVTEIAFRRTDIALPSMEDMKILYNFEDPIEAAEKILDMGVKIVVVKLGGEGCYVSTKEESFHVPGFEVDVLDTTGSGDAFDGAFIVGLLQGRSLRETAVFANAAGALTATGYGAVEPIPKMEDVYKLSMNSSLEEMRSNDRR